MVPTRSHWRRRFFCVLPIRLYLPLTVYLCCVLRTGKANMRIFSNECPLEAMDARRQPALRSTEAEILKRWMEASAGVCLMGTGSNMRAAKWTLIVCEMAPVVCKDGRFLLNPGETSPAPPDRLLSALISWLRLPACISSGWNYLLFSAPPSHECVWWLWIGGMGGGGGGGILPGLGDAFAGHAVFVLHYTSQLSQHRWLHWA